MCGLSALISTDQEIYNFLFKSLLSIQHRGQDGSGTVISDNKEIKLSKKLGLIDNNFNYSKGKIGLGHNRYRTSGECTEKQLQPLEKNNFFLVHNGTLNNIKEPCDSDSQYLLDFFETRIGKSSELDNDKIFGTINRINIAFRGGFAVVILIPSYGIIGFRDPYGIRPLIMGKKNNTYILTSESCAINDIDFDIEREIGPGEAIIIKKDLSREIRVINKISLKPCIFEYIYLARADSVMNGISVYKSRMNMAKKFAYKILSKPFYKEIEVVIAIPDTSNIFAIEIANILGKKYKIGLLRNRYIGRTFIIPKDSIREKIIRRKFSVIGESIKNKNILVIDDSIVRGNTSKHIIRLLKENGARKVFMGSCSPPVKYENNFGIYIPTREELVANNKNIEDIKKYLNCDELIYQDLEDLIDSIKSENKDIKGFEKSIFDQSILI